MSKFETADANRNESRTVLAALLDGKIARVKILQGEACCLDCRSTSDLQPGGPSGAIVVRCVTCWQKDQRRRLTERFGRR